MWQALQKSEGPASCIRHCICLNVNKFVTNGCYTRGVANDDAGAGRNLECEAFLDSDRVRLFFKSNPVTVGLIVMGIAAGIAGVAATVTFGGATKQPIDARLASACEREAAKRSPGGYRELETHSYRKGDAGVGILHGSLRSIIARNESVTLNWACQVRVTSARVLKLEFELRTSGSRLKAATKSF